MTTGPPAPSGRRDGCDPGCGNPMVVAELHEGEKVLDLGSGGGIDVLPSARRVGPSGYAYGVVMTDEMLELANDNKAKAGATNVEFLKGTIDDVRNRAQTLVAELIADRAQRNAVAVDRAASR